jgi:hypothetical protein
MKPFDHLVLAGVLCVASGLAFGQGANASASSSAPRWKNGLPAGEDYFPIAVWLQDPRNATRYKAAGINLYIGLWRGPTTNRCSPLSTARSGEESHTVMEWRRRMWVRLPA